MPDITTTPMPERSAYYLRRVTDAAAQLERDLEELILAANRNLASLRAGQGMSTYGTLLGQRPGDVDASFAKLDTLVQMSHLLPDVTQDDLMTAYTQELKTP